MKKRNMGYRMLSAILVFVTLVAGITHPVYGNYETSAGSELNEEQKNSIAMLNYLSFLTEEINASQNSRLYLQDADSALINNTNPELVDSRTQTQLLDLLDLIEKYRMVDVKRDRLQYIFEQKQAENIRSAIPNPLTLLNVMEAKSKAKLAISIVYMAIDAVSSYDSAKERTALENLQDGWELDDEQEEAFHQSRKDSLDYMLDMVRENKLPGDITLTPKSIEDFVKCQNNTNNAQKIQFLETNRDKYKAFGNYWLISAQCYYDDEKYQKCLDCINEYLNLNIKIFRYDRDLAKTLPLAVDALEQLYAEKIISFSEYSSQTNEYLDLIRKNTEDEDWSLRYFIAQTYVSLAGRTKMDKYLQQAFDVTKNNVSNLIEEQIKQNKAYLAKEVKIEPPKNASKQQKIDIENYNKSIKKARKIELPPINEPLLINCELLFALAGKLRLSEEEKNNIDVMLHGNDTPLFLIPELDKLYSFSGKVPIMDTSTVAFGRTEISIPAKYVSSDAAIKVTVIENGKLSTYEDWTVEEVERGKVDDLATFTAIYSSKAIKNQKFTEDSKIIVKITPKQGSECKDVIIKFKQVDKTIIPGFFSSYVQVN